MKIFLITTTGRKLICNPKSGLKGECPDMALTYTVPTFEMPSHGISGLFSIVESRNWLYGGA
jgi:hypothetical protein